MRYATTCALLISMLTLGIVYPSFAQNQKISRKRAYAGASLGFSDVDVDVDSPEKSSVSDSPLAYKFYGGLQFHPNLAGEITLASFDETKESIDSSTDLSLQDNVIMLQAVGLFPLGNRLGIFGKFGPVFVTRDVEVDDSDPADPEASVDTEDVGTGLGAGIEYALTDNVSLRTELEALFYDANLDTDTDLGDIKSESERIVGTVSVQFNF